MAQANEKKSAILYLCKDIDGTLTISTYTNNKTTNQVMKEVYEATKRLRRGLG